MPAFEYELHIYNIMLERWWLIPTVQITYCTSLTVHNEYKTYSMSEYVVFSFMSCIRTVEPVDTS